MEIVCSNGTCSMSPRIATLIESGPDFAPEMSTFVTEPASAIIVCSNPSGWLTWMTYGGGSGIGIRKGGFGTATSIGTLMFLPGQVTFGQTRFGGRRQTCISGSPYSVI